jgi:hypothetical protein
MRSRISPALALTVSLRGPQSSSWDRDWGGLKPAHKGGGEVFVRGKGWKEGSRGGEGKREK